MASTQHGNSNQLAPIVALQHVKSSGHFYCSVGTNTVEEPSTETQRFEGGTTGTAHVLKEMGLMLSSACKPGTPVIAEVYGRESSRTAGGDLVLALVTTDNRLCILACRVRDNLQDVVDTLARSPKLLTNVMAIFDERFSAERQGQTDGLQVPCNGWPSRAKKEVVIDEHREPDGTVRMLPRFVSAGER
jgi:hypothetical protein